MADPKRAVFENVPGAFFVDRTCIDCDTCRQLAPHTFGEADQYAYVKSQPTEDAARRKALHALLSCPTGSIGVRGASGAMAARDELPLLIEDEVSYTGFTSRDSFGGSSYFVQHPQGNWLVDSPRYVSHLVRQFERLGGIDTIFLTHQDDVADADRYAARFGSRRVLHAADRRAQPEAELLLEGTAPVDIAPDFLVIPTPGHTRGHCVLLYRGRFLFTGDHLWWSRPRQRMHASPDVCWYSWPHQIRSMRRLLEFGFEWVLPGHGERRHLPASEMRQQLESLVTWMEAQEA